MMCLFVDCLHLSLTVVWLYSMWFVDRVERLSVFEVEFAVLLYGYCLHIDCNCVIVVAVAVVVEPFLNMFM